MVNADGVTSSSASRELGKMTHTQIGTSLGINAVQNALSQSCTTTTGLLSLRVERCEMESH